MQWRTKIAIGIGLTTMVLGTGVAQAATWRFALEEIEGSVQDQYAQKFAEMMEKRTDGEVNVEIYPYGEIGGMTDIYDAVQSGAVQLAFGSGFLGGTVPESQLFSLNFILSNDQWTNAQALNSEAFLESDALVNSFNERSLQPLSVVVEGWQVWTANKPIRTPEDFDGVAIRTMDNRLLSETYSAYGASPTTIEYGELYSALQLGQADGNIQPVFAHEEMGFYEVQDYMIFANQAEFIATFMANQSWYSGLSKKMKTTVGEVTDELVRYIHEQQVELNDNRLQTIKDNSDIEIIELTQEERMRFRELAQPVQQTFVDMVGERGGTLVDLLKEQVAKQKAARGEMDSEMSGEMSGEKATEDAEM